MTPRVLTLFLVSCVASGLAFVGVGVFPRSGGSGALSLARHAYRSPIRCAAGDPMDEDDEADAEDREGVAKMKASEIKAELEMRGISHEGYFEKEELVDKLIEARSLGLADPSVMDAFNRDNLERKMDPEKAEAFAQDLLDQDKLKDLTAADGTLPGGLTPDQLSKLVSNPEVMVLMQDSKMQEIMKKVMAGGPSAMESLQTDPEAAELLQKLDKAMASVQ